MEEKYISVTKFKESLAKLIVEGGTEATRAAIARTLNEVVPQIIDDEPAADVQPVHHGKWECERYEELLECYAANCSECGYESTDKFRITPNHRCCEYCGAKMDLKDGDSE